MNNTLYFLIEFVKSALWDSMLDTNNSLKCDMSDLLKKAEKQSIVGLVTEGIKKNGLFEHCVFPEKMLWIALTTQIEVDNERCRMVLKQVFEELNSSHIPVAFMKGLVVGNRYPNPNRRQCGDIDFIVGKHNFGKTLDALDKIGRVHRSLIHEHHGMAFVDGVTLEPHFKVHNFQNPKVNSAMEDIFLKGFPKDIVYERIGEY